MINSPVGFEQITPMLLTYNEAPNIRRTLERLTWAKRIVVIDSYSTDETLEILQSFPQVDLFQRAFDTLAQQCNFGLEKIETNWVLSMDADYYLSDNLIAKIKTWKATPKVNAYKARFKYCVFGKPLRATLLPPRTVLYRRSEASYYNDGHAHRVKVNGQTARLDTYILHDDRKTLSRWLWAQDRYLKLEAQKLNETPSDQLSMGDKVRKQKWIAPFVIVFYCLILKGGILDGWRGWYYAFQRMLAELLLSLRLMEIEKLKL